MLLGIPLSLRTRAFLPAFILSPDLDVFCYVSVILYTWLHVCAADNGFCCLAASSGRDITWVQHHLKARTPTWGRLMATHRVLVS
jgi:hypothetical protein